MKNNLRTILLLALLLTTSGCFTTQHTVGGGPTGTEVVEARQWYWLFGLGRIAPYVDSETLAGNATSYRVETSWSAVDIFLNLVTTLVTIQSRTIRVYK